MENLNKGSEQVLVRGVCVRVCVCLSVCAQICKIDINIK